MSEAEMDARAKAAVKRLERESVAWPRSYKYARFSERPEDAWRDQEASWVVFSLGGFFEITIARGRVVERSRPSDRARMRKEIRGRLEYEEIQRPVERARAEVDRAARRAEMSDEAFVRFEREWEGARHDSHKPFVERGWQIPLTEVPLDFALVPIPGELHEEIRIKTDTRQFPMLLATHSIGVYPRTYGPVDPDREPERWAAESKVLMNDLALLEPIRSIRFTNAAELAALLSS